MRINRALVSFVVILLGVTAAVYGAQTLFTDTFPPVPASVAVLAPGCTATTVVPVPASVAPGSTGGVYFGCGTGCTPTGCTTPAVTGAAFTVAADGAAIPTFSLPSPYTGISIAQLTAVPTTGCTTSTGPTALTSGLAFSFTGANGKGNTFYYCVTYTAAPATGLPSFPISWSQ